MMGFTRRDALVTAGVGTLAALGAPLAPIGAFAGEEPLGPTEGLIEGSRLVGGYTADSAGNHSVNSFWLRTRDGLVLIDGQWRLSDARRTVEAMARTEDRPITSALLTHAHSDHFGGWPVFFAAAGAPIPYLAGSVATRAIGNDEQGFIANRKDQFGDDFPSKVPIPTRTLNDGERLQFADLEVETAVWRGNEANETTVFYLPAERALFVGDLVNNRQLPVLYQGDLDGWIHQLDLLAARFPDAETIYPGHGRPGPAAALIAAEREVLVAFRDAIGGALVGDARVSEAEREAIRTAIVRRFPDWRTTAGIPTRDALIARNIEWTLAGWRIAGAGDGADPRVFRE